MRKTALVMLVVVALMLAACGTAPTDAPAQTGSTGPVAPPPADTGTDSGSSDEDDTSSDPVPAGGTLGTAQFDDLVPLGTEVEVGQWRVTLLSINPDAWAELADVEGIDPPASGHQYVVARVQVTNSGDSGNRTDLGLSRSYTGSDGESYFSGDQGHSCADIPEGVNDPATREMPGGASQEMSFCWSVPANVVQGGAIKVSQFVTGEGYVSAMFEGVR